MKIQDIKLKQLEIHPLAETTPKYSKIQFQALIDDLELKGQLNPITVYNNMILDGRHRFLAFKELKKETIKAKVYEKKLTKEEIMNLIESSEMRRHQTPSQLAIMAWYYYTDPNNKVTMAEAAKKFGASLANIKRANKIGGIGKKHFKRPDILDLIYNGNKFQIEHIKTDSLAAIENYLTKEKNKIKEQYDENKNIDILTENEEELVNEILLKVTDESKRVQRAISKKLFAMTLSNPIN